MATVSAPDWRDAWSAAQTTDLNETVSRVGTAGYRAWTAGVREQVNQVYLDPSGWAHIAARTWLTANLRAYWERAWQDGIKEFGLTMRDMTANELMALQAAIAADTAAIPGFVSFLNQHRASSEISAYDERGRPIPAAEYRKRAFKLDLFKRVDARQQLWWNAYHRVQNQARQLAAGDRPMMWVLGPTEQHCPDCSGYDGRVYRASTWARYDIRPQHPGLSCHGFNCQCRLVVTDQPPMRGRPPAMTG